MQEKPHSNPLQPAETTADLVEGEDFVWEKGLMVLTRQYLLRRGHCCHQQCQNCPYGSEENS